MILYKTRFPMWLAMLLLSLSLLSAAGCSTTSTRESTGGYVDDSAITLKVKTAIFNDPALKVFQISVKTYKGTVQLSGFVNSQEVANHAAEVAKGVAGVASVENDLQVKQD